MEKISDLLLSFDLRVINSRLFRYWQKGIILEWTEFLPWKIFSIVFTATFLILAYNLKIAGVVGLPWGLFKLVIIVVALILVGIGILIDLKAFYFAFGKNKKVNIFYTVIRFVMSFLGIICLCYLLAKF